MFNLKDKVVLVVGGRGYLGREFCQALRSQNATVISADLPSLSKAANKAEFDNNFNDIEQVKPIYETFPGWQVDTTKAKIWNDLPPKARKYLKAVSQSVGAKIVIASVGPARNQTIFR